MPSRFVLSTGGDRVTFDDHGERTWYCVWPRRDWPYRDLKVGDTLYWYEPDDKAILWETRVLEVDPFQYHKKQELAQRLRTNLFDENPEIDPYFQRKADSGYCLGFKVRLVSALNVIKPSTFFFPQLGWLRCDASEAIEWMSHLPETTSDISCSQREDIEELTNNPTISATEKKTLIDARLGQGKFRESVLRKWGRQCAVTSAITERAIRASHIKPWRDSTNDERLDPDNGLPLLANLDALFDAGLISFEASGRMIISPKLSGAERKIFGIAGSSLTKRPTAKMAAYLADHRRRHGFEP